MGGIFSGRATWEDRSREKFFMGEDNFYEGGA